MQKKLLLIFILSVFLFACGSNSNQRSQSRYSEEQIASLHLDSTKRLVAVTDSMIKIDLNSFSRKQAFDFASLIKTVRLIPLETTDESIVDDIDKVIIADSNLVIMDRYKGQGIIIFDKEGRFIKRIPNGQGPGELVRLYDIAYDADNNELVAYRHSFFMFYTPSGEFIRQERLPFGFLNFTVIPDGYIFKTLEGQGNGHLGPLENYTMQITDKKFRLESVGIYCPPLGEITTEPNYIHNNNHVINITQSLSDTVYQYISESEQLKARYVLNYRKKLPERYYNSFEEFDNITRQNDYYYYNGMYLETETHNVFTLENDNTGPVVIFRDKQSGNMKGGIYTSLFTDEMPITFRRISTSGNYLISNRYPYKDMYLKFSNSSLISNEDKLKLKNSLEDDNPFIVFFELTNF